MDIKQLTTFVTLAQTLNYQKAARKLQYSPSTLFKHIQLLEEEMGVALLMRDGRKMQLTPEGERLLDHAKTMLRQYEEMVTDLDKDQEGVVEGILSVGGCEINMQGGISELLRQYSKRYKDVHIDMMTAANVNMPMLVRSGLVDIAFYYCAGDEPLSDLQTEYLYQEPAYLMASSQNPLTQKKGLTYQDLAGSKIAYTHDSCCLIIELLRRMRRREAQTGNVLYLGGFYLVLEEVMKNNALILLPRHVVERYESDGSLVRLDMAEEPVWAWETMLWRSDEKLRRPVRAMIHQGRQFAQKIIDSSGEEIVLTEAE